ncbi:MAG: hypothetical protein QOC86_1681 [Gaiellales bacterium]|nr:hypothetical protein [Gaiellales bacterium]
MNSGGQASVEYAGLLGLAAVLGAVLALTAGPPLAGAVRDALVAALSRTSRAPLAVAVSAADIAAVDSALGGAGATTPDSAIVALEDRHAPARAHEIASAVVLGAVRSAVPGIGRSRTYRAWLGPGDGPYESDGATADDRDVEVPTGSPVAVWVTVAAQRRAVAQALAHHVNLVGLGFDAVGLIPSGGLLRVAARSGLRSFGHVALAGTRGLLDTAQLTFEAFSVVDSHDAGIPAGDRAGDVIVSWPVHRTAWRDGHLDPAPKTLTHGGVAPLVQDYTHLVFLRPGARGLAVIGEAIGA